MNSIGLELSLPVTAKGGTIVGYLKINEIDADIVADRAINMRGGRKGYPAIKRKGKVLTVHKEVALRMGIPGQIDHVDGDVLNATRGNLRSASQSENCMNRGMYTGTKSGLKGVTWYPRYNKWLAQIKSKGKNYNLGYFDDKYEAGRAYDTKAIELFGAFCKTNDAMKLYPGQENHKPQEES